MSSSYTCAATVVQDPESLELGGKPAVKLRLVDKALSKKHEDRFFNALLFGYDAETAARLRKADKILITGTLALTSYVSKKTRQKVQADEMGFGTRILRVLQSPTFFGEAAEGDAPPADDAPADDTTPAGKGPLDDLDL
jgi:single-stranded DNA-binding protein